HDKAQNGRPLGIKNYVRDILNLNPKITNFLVIAAGHGYVDPVTGKDPAIEPMPPSAPRWGQAAVTAVRKGRKTEK
ncbi:hypothetical protein PZH41_26205, partial [Phocaeicola vulgatus]|uniref:hypothetical protein n=1 Tax=Phocaeicola vulgatus TaxID=821 RepID=UPI0023B1BEC3